MHACMYVYRCIPGGARILMSPVRSETSPLTPFFRNHSLNSANFWFERALMGEVYMARCPRANACRIASSATAVFPDRHTLF